MYLLGIDYGTGGGKAAIIDDKAVTLGCAFEEYTIFTDRPGWSEHEAGNYWRLACRLIKKLLAETGVSPGEIAGIAVSSALPSMVMVDRQGDPLARAYNLMDRRAVEQIRRVKETIGAERVFEVTKNRLDDHPSIINLLWEKENRPEVFNKIYKALTIDGFIVSRLTGEFTCHYSGAAFYGVAYNLLEKRFDMNILDAVGISIDLFPRLCDCADVVGTVTGRAAEESGLIRGIPVAAGQVDCNAGWSGAGATRVGDIQMNLGTCGNFGIIHKEPVFHDSMIAFNYTTGSDTYITVPTTTTGGQLIRYMRDNFYPEERRRETNGGTDTYDLINDEAAQAPPGSAGLVVLPYLMGERTPIWDADARGVIFGLSLNHTRGHVLRAMMEAVAYALYDSFCIIRKTGIRINSPIILNEGGAKSRLWRGIITDVFNVPTVLVKNRVGAPFGDGILAGVATGVFPDFSVAREKSEYDDLMEPDKQRHELYREHFSLYKNLYEHVKDDFKSLARLQGR